MFNVIKNLKYKPYQSLVSYEHENCSQIASNCLRNFSRPSDRKAASLGRVSSLRHVPPTVSRAHGTISRSPFTSRTRLQPSEDNFDLASDGRRHLGLKSHSFGSALRVVIKFRYVSNVTHQALEYN